MKPVNKGSALRFLRKIHSLLGVIIFPLVLIIGFTGFYLNHSDTLFSFISANKYDEAQFENWPDPVPATLEHVQSLAASLWPDQKIDRLYRDTYHERPSYFVETADHTLIVSRSTGHYFTKSTFTRKTYDPNGALLDRKFYWGYLFKWLHTRGWPSDLFGTFLADITSVALMVFALSGVVIWWSPRVRKIKRFMLGLRKRPTAYVTIATGNHPKRQQ